MQTRIYVVIHDDEKRLVEATSAAQAIRHCVRPRYNARAASPKDVATMLASGARVERAETEQTINQTL